MNYEVEWYSEHDARWCTAGIVDVTPRCSRTWLDAALMSVGLYVARGLDAVEWPNGDVCEITDASGRVIVRLWAVIAVGVDTARSVTTM